MSGALRAGHRKVAVSVWGLLGLGWCFQCVVGGSFRWTGLGSGLGLRQGTGVTHSLADTARASATPLSLSPPLVAPATPTAPLAWVASGAPLPALSMCEVSP